MQLHRINWRRGLLRVWLVAWSAWAVFVVAENWKEVRYTFRYLTATDELNLKAEARKQKRVEQLGEELITAAREAKEAQQRIEVLTRTGAWDSLDTFPRLELEFKRDRDLEKLRSELANLKASPAVAPEPSLNWLVAIWLPPLGLALASIALYYLGRWLFAGFRAP